MLPQLGNRCTMYVARNHELFPPPPPPPHSKAPDTRCRTLAASGKRWLSLALQSHCRYTTSLSCKLHTPCHSFEIHFYFLNHIYIHIHCNIHPSICTGTWPMLYIYRAWATFITKKALKRFYLYSWMDGCYNVCNIIIS